MSQNWKPQFQMNDTHLINTDVRYAGYCRVKTFQFQIPFFEGGTSRDLLRDVIIRPAAVAVLMYDPENDCVMLIEQFRAGVYALLMENNKQNDKDRQNEFSNNNQKNLESPWILETVAGMCEANHSLRETAFREVMEETGSAALSLTPICQYLVSPGVSSEKTYIFYGRFSCAVEQKGEHSIAHAGLKQEDEDIKVHLFPAETVFNFLKEGKLLSASTVIAIQWLALNRDALRSQR